MGLVPPAEGIRSTSASGLAPPALILGWRVRAVGGGGAVAAGGVVHAFAVGGRSAGYTLVGYPHYSRRKRMAGLDYAGSPSSHPGEMVGRTSPYHGLVPLPAPPPPVDLV